MGYARHEEPGAETGEDLGAVGAALIASTIIGLKTCASDRANVGD